MQMLDRAQKQASSSGMTWNEAPVKPAGDINCSRCRGFGYYMVKREPLTYTECECRKKKSSLESLRRAGMEDMASRYTMETYLTDTPHRQRIKETAERFIAADTGWFFIGGRSGSGKTHICTAICSRLIEKGGSELYFMSWRDESTELKFGMKDFERYKTRLNKLKTVPILYIDDFFKGGASEADLRLAFEILNARYNNSALRTIISSELDLEAIAELDEALGGRILERSRGFAVKAPAENMRLRQ